MTLGEIKDWIEQREKDYPDILKLNAVFGEKHTSYGQTPNKEITTIRVGFDWDSGLVFFESKNIEE